MAFQMKVSAAALEGKDVLPAGLYKVRLVSFSPKFSKPKPGFEGQPTSLNLNAKMEVIDNPAVLANGPRYIYEGLNDAAAWIKQDFSHAFGLPMDTDNGVDFWLPGDWDGEQGKAETYIYRGPLTGQVAEIELAVDSYMGKANNKVSRYICRVKDCAQKFPKVSHSMDLLKKKS